MGVSLLSIVGAKTDDEESVPSSCNRTEARFVSGPGQTAGQAKKSPPHGTWELIAGQQLPKGARDIKVISGGLSFLLLRIRRNGSCFIQAVKHTY